MGECEDTRSLTLEEETEMRYTRLQQNNCMNYRDKSAFCIVYSNNACISTELANLI